MRTANRSTDTTRHMLFIGNVMSDADPISEPRAPMRPILSAREIEVLMNWLRSDSKVAVANSLHISIGTVNTHIARIRLKYADIGRPAQTKAALFARALQDGLTDLTEW